MDGQNRVMASLPESEISEWKSSWHDEYMKWISAFAYTHGGILYIGVNDDGYVVGLKDYRKLLEDLPNKFRDKLHITPDVRLKFASESGTNIRYTNGVPLCVASKLVNKYVCGDIAALDENEKRNLERIKVDNPLYRDLDGRYYYIEIEVRHYPGLVTYNGVQYSRSGSTLQIVEGIELERKILSIQDERQNFYVNRVYPVFSVSDLRKDLIERARRSAVSKRENHPWKDSSDEELLRSCGLILIDPETGKEGLTLAAILLFGTDSLIMSVCYQHKTDAIVRIFDTDRYDDRDVIITNLIESYDRLMIFGQRHLNDRFVLSEEEIGKGTKTLMNVSARDRILREVVSNILMHRDYSSGYVAKMVIEKEKIELTNANRPHGYGNLDISSFVPYQKNPSISKVFREMGLADELGSGMRNSYKYTRLYSGGEPVFSEDGDVFKIVIPLNRVATVTAGPTVKQKGKVLFNGVEIKLSTDAVNKLLLFCQEPKTRDEIMEKCGIRSRNYFRLNILNPMLKLELLKLTIPDKPNSPNQKYVSR